MLGLLGFCLAHPTALIIYAWTKVRARRLRGSLLGLGVGWPALSEACVVTESYMWTSGYDATGLMYVVNAVVFYGTIRNFRKSASITGFVERPSPVPGLGPGGAVSGEVSQRTGDLAGRKVLYEVDPKVSYEVNLRQTIEELALAGSAVYVFTSKSSPLHVALTGAAGVKIFLTTSDVSYMKAEEDKNVVLVPQSDTAVFLDIADKALASEKGKVAVVFDSVSDLLLMSGTEKTYKFLKQFLEILHEPRSTGLFLFISKAHDLKDVNLMRGIFPSQFVENEEGSRLVK